MALGKILEFGRSQPDALLLHTADWSYVDRPDAPSADRVITAYEERFGHTVRASGEVASTGAPQVEIRVDTSDLPWLERARRLFFAGEQRSEEDRETWNALRSRLLPATTMHEMVSPEVHFPFTAAAAIAFTEITRNVTVNSTLIGYRALKPDETHANEMDSHVPATTGAPPPDRFEEGGHLFRFRSLRERNSKTQEESWTVLIGATGIHVKEGEGDPRENAILSMLDARRNRMPDFLKEAPDFDRTVPPPEYRLSLSVSFWFDSHPRDYKIEDMERSIGLALHKASSKRGYVIHIDLSDLSDLSDWPDVRNRLLGGADVAADLPILRDVLQRLNPILEKVPRPHLSDTSAVLACLLKAQKNLKAKSLRLAGRHYIHPYQLEKMSDWDHYPKAPSVPLEGPVSAVAPDEPPSDFGLGCLFEIDGEIERGWYEP